MELRTQQQQLDRETIARLAYQIWEQRGCPHGYDVDFWLEAERQFLSAGKPGRQESTVPAGASPGGQTTTKAAQAASQGTRQTKPSPPSGRSSMKDQQRQPRVEIA
jgi:hypothetical protein